MRSLKLWAVIPIACLALLCAFSAEARVTVFAWDAVPSWPAGTTVELEANGATATGITGTQYTLDVPVQPGEMINARARAIPPAGYECGDPLALCSPSPWTTLAQTLPDVPSGLWARWTRQGNSVMAVIETTSTVSYAARTNTTITAPSGIVNGDVLLAILDIGQSSAPTVTPPSGFTEITTTGWPMAINAADPWQVRVRAYTKIASSESGNYTFSHSSAYSEAIMYRISGADTTTPVNPNPTSGSGNSTTSIAPGITTPRNNSVVVFVSGAWNAAGPTTPPTGTTPTFTEYFDGGAGGVFYSAAGVLATAGATGDKSNTNGNGNSWPWVAGLICIQAASGGGSQALAGTPQAVASATGAVQMALPVAATSVSAATAVGSLSMALPLQAAASFIASATGGVTLRLSVAGAALAEVLSSGALGMTMPLTGDAAVGAAASGDVTTGSEIDLSGNAAVDVSAAGAFEQATGMAGAAAAKAVGVGTITLSMALAGSAVAEALAAAGVTLESALAAQAAAEASGSGAAGMTTGLIGGAAAEVTGSADAGMTLPLAGDAAGEVASTGDLTTLAEGALAGAALAVPTTVGALGLTTPVAGIANVLATAGGALGVNIPAAGDAAAVVLSTGNLQVSTGIPLSAAALAAASASGALSITIPMDAVALAQAVAIGALSGGTDTFTPYVGRTWTPGYTPRIWEPLASQRTWIAAANNRTWRR